MTDRTDTPNLDDLILELRQEAADWVGNEPCAMLCGKAADALSSERASRIKAEAELDHFKCAWNVSEQDIFNLTQKVIPNIREQAEARAEQAREALEAISGFGDVDLSGEVEHSLRDIIKSMTDCAKRALKGKGES